jgi:hypothetical protein
MNTRITEISVLFYGTHDTWRHHHSFVSVSDSLCKRTVSHSNTQYVTCTSSNAELTECTQR